MGDEWDGVWNEFEEPGREERPRDAKTDEAKVALRHFFEAHTVEVFYETQLMIRFERQFFHWITVRALDELEEEGLIVSDLMTLTGAVPIRIYRSVGHRYWGRQARQLIDLVRKFSTETMGRAIGRHGELMFDAALARFGFTIASIKVREYQGRTWTETGHDLDRIYERDGTAYGAEIKNRLTYIDRNELRAKIRLCRHLKIRLLFIMRTARKATTMR